MKHCIIKWVAVLIIAGSLTGMQNRCFAQKEVFADANSLEGTWKLMPVLASDTATGRFPVLQFNVSNHSFIGNTGCNSMSGKFKLTGMMLSFNEQEVITKNDCRGYNEDAFMGSLMKVNHYKIEDGVLELMVDQTVLSKWVRKEPLNAPKTI